MIYLDNSATTKARAEVLETFVSASEQFYANPASLHKMGNAAEDLLEQARQQAARLLHMQHVIFTSGGTESNNLAIAGTARAHSHRGRHIISSAIEHPSVLNTLQALELEGFEVTLLPVDSEGQIRLQDLQDALRKDTILVTLMHVNNELGTVLPIEEVAGILKPTRTLFHVDAVQSAGKLPIDPSGLPDLLSVSAHKFHGLKGSGVLAYNQADFRPVLHGGGQESGRRSGTVSVPHAAAFAKALRLMEPNPLWPEWNRELRAFFSKYPEVKIISPRTGAPYILTGAMQGIKGEVLVSALQQQSVIVSTSSACSSKNLQASHVIDAISLPPALRDGVFRISLGAMTESADIAAFKQAFDAAYRVIKGEQTQ
ncbi:cysteine desulfurase family protein [Planococcus lenghuensis]|uniref:Aminotransferase class V n=1 Tax=Planococcus lenghuensis TaxID=2213202 RepID=A0A1Q2KYC2_9BACL|nr:cysteine desulfurase family protein [Planococcus lenghuensis]AQQ52797.1 aminotransferase class V [Planococcus lenghuensis]